MPLPRIRVLIADGQSVAREGLRRLLEGERDFVVVGEATDSTEAMAVASSVRPDVLLLDLSIPGAALDTLRGLAATHVEVKTVLMAAELDRQKVVEALLLGARGVLLKSSPADLLCKALRTVMNGQHWVDRQTVADVLEALRHVSLENHAAETGDSKFGLTARQLQIVSCVVAGRTNREIAATLTISEDTVKHHLTQIFIKTGVGNRVELALLAMQHQLGGAV